MTGGRCAPNVRHSTAMPRLQSVLARIDGAHRGGICCERNAHGTRLLNSGRLRYEMSLCALFDSHDRLRSSERALERSWSRLLATKRRLGKPSSSADGVHDKQQHHDAKQHPLDYRPRLVMLCNA